MIHKTNNLKSIHLANAVQLLNMQMYVYTTYSTVHVKKIYIYISFFKNQFLQFYNMDRDSNDQTTAM